jgi:hypothetical protein
MDPDARTQRATRGRTPCPRCGNTCARLEKALELMCAPKGVGPRPVGHFSCKAATFKGAAMGAHGGRSWTPTGGLRPCGSCERRPCPRCGSTSRECQRKKALELMCAPKGGGPHTPRRFLLQRGNFWGCRRGGEGCQSWTPAAELLAPSRALAGGEGYAPVVAGLRASAKARPSGPCENLWRAGRGCGHAPLLRAYPHTRRAWP